MSSPTDDTFIDTFTLETAGRFAFANIKTPPDQIHTYFNVIEHDVSITDQGRKINLTYEEQVRTSTQLTLEKRKAEVLDVQSTKTWTLLSP